MPLGTSADRPEPEIDENSTKLVHLLKVVKPPECKPCGKSFKAHFDVAFHSKTHSANGQFNCHLCSYSVKSKFRIRCQVKSHSGYLCKVCNKKFKKSATALKHSYIHTNENPFQCQICRKHLASSSSLQAHINTVNHRVVTGEPLVKYDCIVCRKHYESESGLRQHYSSTHKEMGVDLSVICEICGKRISSGSRLTGHIRTHTGQKPYTCLECNKSFATKFLLTTHMRVHTGEKPFVCAHCGKSFGQSAPYRYYVKIHTGERKCVCRLCGKGFISNSNMKLHLITCNAPLKEAFNGFQVKSPST